jgi:TIR domain-containing protein
MLLGAGGSYGAEGVRVGEYFFVSYSAVDGANFALSLADKLTAGPPSYHLWVDRRELKPGDDWDEQLVEAIRAMSLL